MKENPQNKNEKNIEDNPQINNENIEKKNGFFRTMWYSIDKIEKYPELAAEGLKKAIKYLTQIVFILAIAISAISVYKTSTEIKQIANYINEKAPNFSYKDNLLTSEEVQDVVRDENDEFGKIIIDLQTTDEEQIGTYINEMENEENGIIILNNQMIMKENTKQVKYEYSSLLNQIGINEFNKQELVDYLLGTGMMNLYLGLFVSLLIYAFIIYFINTLVNVSAIAIFGYVATFIMKMKMRFVAVFNMAVYSITLSTLLNVLYAIISGLFNYQIKYFDVMYTLVSVIYMVAAIFMLRADFNKKQGEVQKIVEVEKEVKEEIKKQKEDKEEKDKKEEEKKNKETGKNKENEKKDKETKDDLDGEEPAGSNA